MMVLDEKNGTYKCEVCGEIVPQVSKVLYLFRAKVAIHNSDYESTDACAQTINRHFAERNAHFQLHPKKPAKSSGARNAPNPGSTKRITAGIIICGDDA